MGKGKTAVIDTQCNSLTSHWSRNHSRFPYLFKIDIMSSYRVKYHLYVM